MALAGCGSSPRGRGTPGRSATRRPFAVHPRAGGEHATASPIHSSPIGSSPRGRGTRHGRALAHWRRRFIPARAGNTRSRSSGPYRPAVHPRAGGEHVLGVHGDTDGTVHPRAGGEHAPQRDRTPLLFGSSPRGRGTRRLVASADHRAVHPRAGGEHHQPDRAPREPHGSSPRGRGTLASAWLLIALLRFIPARAGNTGPMAPDTRPGTVHPRAGGEHRPPPGGEDELDGSSPRGRGTLVGGGRLGGRQRFIPARAGNTTAPRVVRVSSTVHPRAGGEHLHEAGVLALFGGSSPRGRGNTAHTAANKRVCRFIPARAGNTHTLALNALIDRFIPARAGNTRSCRRGRFIPARAGNTARRVRSTS